VSDGTLEPPSAFVARFDPQGTLRWDVRFTGAQSATASGLALDPSGNAIVVGSYSGGSLTAGSLDLGDAGDVAPFVVALSPKGTIQWADTYGDADTTAVTVAADADRVIVGGGYSGSFGGKLPKRGLPAVYLLSLSPSGDVQAVSSPAGLAGATEESEVSCMTLQGSDVVMGGTFQGTLEAGDETLTSQGGFDVFVGRVKL
jgi:hypothetical protein